jgi:hypothetical protein
MSAEGVRLLEEQLGRMRGMLYNYYDQFYRFLNMHLIALFVLMAIALWGAERVALLLPFYAIFIGFHSSYLFSYVIFARTYATAIEKHLNAQLGDRYLVAHELEAAYIFPFSTRRFVSFSPVNPGSFLSAETVQFTLGLGALTAVFGVWATRIAWDIDQTWGLLYLAGLLVWVIGTLSYLVWYHLISDYEDRPRRILEERYGVRFITDDGSPA